MQGKREETLGCTGGLLGGDCNCLVPLVMVCYSGQGCGTGNDVMTISMVLVDCNGISRL